jgi:ABC-2 type transport system permease protein
MPAPSRAGALVRLNLTLAAREPGPVISRVAMPVVIVFALRPLYTTAFGDQARGTAQAVTGMLVMFSLFGMSLVGHSVLTERSWHTLDRLRATPTHPASLLLGKGVPVLLLVLAQQVVVLTLGGTVLDLRVASYGLLVLAVAVWALALLCVGTALAMLVRSHSALGAVIDVGAMLCTCLGGALIPLDTMPGWARSLAPLSPGYWAMRALGGALAGDGRQVVVAAGVLAAVALVAAAIAAVRLSRGWGRSNLL